MTVQPYYHVKKQGKSLCFGVVLAFIICSFIALSSTEMKVPILASFVRPVSNLCEQYVKFSGTYKHTYYLKKLMCKHI